MHMFVRSLSTAMVLLLAAVAPAAGQESTATVTVFHAVPADDGFPADVYLNGDLIIDGFVFEAASELFTVPAGPAELQIFAEGADPDTDSPAISDQVTFEAGLDYSIVAQVVGEAPVLTVFINDTSEVGTGQGRLTVRQTSGVADLDVRLDGEDLFDGLAQATDATADIAAGSHNVSFLSVGETLAERSVLLSEGRLTVLYAVGSPTDDSFNLLVQRVVAQQTPPAGVPTGTGGLKAHMNWTPVFLVVLALALLAALRRLRGSPGR